MNSIDNNPHVNSIWNELNSGINNSPQNLILHTQRILFCIDNELSEQACAALQDMLIILEGRGQALQSRMFNIVSPVLENEDRLNFQQYLLEQDSGQLKSRQYQDSIFNSIKKNNSN